MVSSCRFLGLDCVFSLTLLVVNAYSVKAFGLVEYWFSTIKVFAIIVFILLAIGILTQGHGGTAQVLSNLTEHGGFFLMVLVESGLG